MIPRLKPNFGYEELVACMQPKKGAVERFEQEFARLMGTRFGLAFEYGRSALWALFKAYGIEKKEIIVPAYTCVVVPHSIVK